MRKAHVLQRHMILVTSDTVRTDFRFNRHDFTHARNEPRINLGGFVDLIFGQTQTQGLGDRQQAIRLWLAQKRHHSVLIHASICLNGIWNLDFIQTVQTGLHARQRLLQTFMEVTTDCHRFTD